MRDSDIYDLPVIIDRGGSGGSDSSGTDPVDWYKERTARLKELELLAQAQATREYLASLTPHPNAGGIVDSGRFPGGTGGISRPNTAGAVTGGGLASGGRGPLPTNYMGGSTWNTPAPRTPTAPPASAPGFGGGMQWLEGPSTGTGGPEGTGEAMPFSPYGVQQDVSSEILRYGGQPNSGAGGRWAGTPQAAPMQQMFTPNTSGGSAAGGMKPWDIYNSAIADALRNGTTQQSRTTPGQGYQNTVISGRDGEVWADPTNGQTYVFYNGKWNKADLSNRYPEGMEVDGPSFNRDDVGGTPTNGWVPPGPVT